jgi:hypothetical protein
MGAISQEHCRGCARSGSRDCEATFVCGHCGKERSVCAYLPGGFKAFTTDVVMGPRECVLCEEARNIGEDWVDKWHRKLKVDEVSTPQP